MPAFTLGPFSFSSGLVAACVAVMVLFFVGNRVARGRDAGVDGRLWIVVIVALVGARIAYVARFSTQYADSPWSVLDIRDGGLTLWAAFVAGLAAVVLVSWRSRASFRPVLAGALSGAAVLALSAVGERAWTPADVRLPQLVLTRLEGGTLDMAALAGKPVVLNIWATWCPPCRREMPVLRQAQRDHPDITFLFVNQGETREQIRAYLSREQMELANIVADPGGAVATALNSKGLPTTFFFDPDGKMTSRRTGELSAATLAQRLEVLQAAPVPAGK